MWIDLPLFVKHVRIFESLVNAHQRLTLAEKNFHNQVDTETHSMDIIHPISLATPLIK